MKEARPPQQTTVLVTGISGFLGGHVALQLLQQGYRVRGTLRRMASAAATMSRFQPFTENLGFVEADLDHASAGRKRFRTAITSSIPHLHFRVARCAIRQD